METYETLIEEVAENIGVGVHTTLRKACDSEGSTKTWNAINDMDSEEWSMVVRIVAEHTVNFIIKPFFEAEIERLKEMLKNYGCCPQRLKGKTKPEYICTVCFHGFEQDFNDRGRNKFPKCPQCGSSRNVMHYEEYQENTRINAQEAEAESWRLP